MIFSVYVFLKAAECGFTVAQQKKSLEVVPPLYFYKGTIGIPFFVVDTQLLLL